MTRRGFALLAAAATLRADTTTELFELVASMANGLSEGNAAAFEAGLSNSLAERERLLDDVRAMVEQAEVTSAIDWIRDEGDDGKRTAIVDWSIRLKRRGPDLRTVERRETVRLTAVREARKWRVTSLDPRSFFAPADFR